MQRDSSFKVKIGVTGANGFIGRKLIQTKLDHFDFVPKSVRFENIDLLSLKGYSSILHLGGVAHRMNETNPDVYFQGNYELTKGLALKAKENGVKHFVFISTIKVFGEKEEFLDLNSPCNPINDPYGESKLKAEKFLQSIESKDFKVAIIRPPLVYGPGVKGNLHSLIKLAELPIPLPLKNISNRRSMVNVFNLIALINKVLENRASGVFLAGDRSPISTTLLVEQIRNSLGMRNNLVSVPFFKMLLNTFKPELEKRLFGSLEMHTAESFKKLNFVPPYSFEEGIESMVKYYLVNK